MSSPKISSGLLTPLIFLLIALSVNPAWSQSPPNGQSYSEIRVQLTPRQETILSSEVGGKVEELTVLEGESFTKGQTLVRLDCELHETRLNKARALHKEAESIEQVSARLDQLGNISSLEYSSAIARLAAAAAEAQLMEAIVQRCMIRAPFDGKVVELIAQPYQFVAEGQELLEVLDDSIMLVEMIVPSPWLASINLGQQVNLRIEETGLTYPAVIERIGARIDPVSQSVKLYGSIEGSFPELRSGMSGTATLGEQ